VERRFTEAEFPVLAIRINEGLRRHPDVERGVGATALISFIEVLKAMQVLEGAVSVRTVAAAALTTFPHRVKAKMLISTDKVVMEVLNNVLAYLEAESGPTLGLCEEGKSCTDRKVREGLEVRIHTGKSSSLVIPPQSIGSLISESQKPTLLDILLCLMSSKNGESVNLIHVRKELIEQLNELGLVKSTGRANEYSLELSPETDKLVRKILELHLSQLIKEGKVLEETSKDLLQTLLMELDRLLQLQAKEGRHGNLGGIFMFQLPNFPIINKILEEWAKQRRKEITSDEWLKRAAIMDGLRGLIDTLKSIGYIEEKEGTLRLSREAYRLILDKVLPEIESLLTPTTKPRLGQGDEEEVVDVRPYRVGDRYSDISIRATIRRMIRRRLEEPKRRDLIISQKEPRRPIDIMFAVDSSMSMGSDGKLDAAKRAAIGLAIAAVERGDCIGVVAFSDKAEEVIELSNDPEERIEKIFGLRPVGSTNIEEALSVSCRALIRSRSPNQKHIILVTDGEPTSYTLRGRERDPEASKYGYYSPVFSRMAALREARRLRMQGITISTICINKLNFGERQFCERLAKVGGGRSYIVHSGKELIVSTLEEYGLVRSLYY
jgi:Mg-chelatase subunit ChlD